MPIIYRHEIKERNPKPTPQRKYGQNVWVMFEGKHCQVKGYELKDGVPMYTVSLPSKDGTQLFTVHQRDLSDPSAVVISEKDREDSRARVKTENERYIRD